MTGPDPTETTPLVAPPKTRTTRTTKAAMPENTGDQTTPVAIQPTAEIAADVAPAVAAATPVMPDAPKPEAPAPVAAASTPPAPAAAPALDGPADSAPGAAGAPSPAPRRATPDVAAAVDKAYAQLRERLTLGEIVAGAGALIVLGVAWFFFGWLFDQRGALPGEVPLIISATLLAVLVLQNVGVHDFGPNYRLIVTGLCMGLGFLAAVELLEMVRWASNGASFNLGGLNWWLGAIVAVVGGWMVWRQPR